MNGAIPPQVIRRGDKYVVQEVDLDSMSRMQRLAVACEIWEQVRTLMEINGEYRAAERGFRHEKGVGKYEDITRTAAECTGSAWSELDRIRPRLLEHPDVLARMKNNEFESMKDVARALGFKVASKLSEGRRSEGKGLKGYYGKGDKFTEATEPILRYFHAWEKKGFQFPHVPPKEAKKRLAQIEKIEAYLVLVREDLAQRSHVATYAAPSEKRKKETPR